MQHLVSMIERSQLNSSYLPQRLKNPIADNNQLGSHTTSMSGTRKVLLVRDKQPQPIYDSLSVEGKSPKLQTNKQRRKKKTSFVADESDEEVVIGNHKSRILKIMLPKLNETGGGGE